MSESKQIVTVQRTPLSEISISLQEDVLDSLGVAIGLTTREQNESVTVDLLVENEEQTALTEVLLQSSHPELSDGVVVSLKELEEYEHKFKGLESVVKMLTDELNKIGEEKK